MRWRLLLHHHLHLQLQQMRWRLLYLYLHLQQLKHRYIHHQQQQPHHTNRTKLHQPQLTLTTRGLSTHGEELRLVGCHSRLSLN